MTKSQLIEWIENNIVEHGNVGCALRLLEQNINAINNPPPAFAIDLCKETTKKLADDTMESDFFVALMERKAAMQQTAIHS